MKHLNDINGFQWVSKVRTDGSKLAKTTIGHESFWLRECEEKDGVWTAKVDNALLFTDEHGLDLNDSVSFTL